MPLRGSDRSIHLPVRLWRRTNTGRAELILSRSTPLGLADCAADHECESERDRKRRIEILRIRLGPTDPLTRRADVPRSERVDRDCSNLVRDVVPMTLFVTQLAPSHHGEVVGVDLEAVPGLSGSR